MIFGPQLAKDARADLRDAKCEPSRGEAAARCGSVWNRKFSIQNSRFKIKRVDADADANSGPSRGEAAARCGSLSKPQIQNSKFKIQN